MLGVWGGACAWLCGGLGGGWGGVAGGGKGESLMLAETRVGKNNNSFSETGIQQAYEAKM